MCKKQQRPEKSLKSAMIEINDIWYSTHAFANYVVRALLFLAVLWRLLILSMVLVFVCLHIENRRFPFQRVTSNCEW